jgi:hypothetical protein
MQIGRAAMRPAVRITLRSTIVAAAALSLAGCISSRPAEPAGPAPDEALSTVINAPAQRVQRVIVSRARARGTSGHIVDSRTVVLERALPSSPPALEAMCGAHQLGRVVRIVITTDEQAGGPTRVVERRFVVDHGAKPCPVKLSQGDIESGDKSLDELKAEVESPSARR